jgi:hypothetical protein
MAEREPSDATKRPDAAMVEEALHNLIVLARPHFSDETQMLALSEAERVLAALRTEGEAAGDDLRETLRSMADELDGLIPYLASHHYDVTKLTGLIGKARGFEGRDQCRC